MKDGAVSSSCPPNCPTFFQIPDLLQIVIAKDILAAVLIWLLDPVGWGIPPPHRIQQPDLLQDDKSLTCKCFLTFVSSSWAASSTHSVLQPLKTNHFGVSFFSCNYYLTAVWCIHRHTLKSPYCLPVSPSARVFFLSGSVSFCISRCNLSVLYIQTHTSLHPL